MLCFQENKTAISGYYDLEGEETQGGKAKLEVSIGTHRTGREGQNEGSDHGHGKIGRDSMEEGQSGGYDGSSTLQDSSQNE